MPQPLGTPDRLIRKSTVRQIRHRHVQCLPKATHYILKSSIELDQIMCKGTKEAWFDSRYFPIPQNVLNCSTIQLPTRCEETAISLAAKRQELEAEYWRLYTAEVKNSLYTATAIKHW
jgi:hypothetical protein